MSLKVAKIMAIQWEDVPDSEVRAEVEAVLESQGETKRIRTYLNQSPEVQEWKEQINQMCSQLITEIGIENVTPDILYQKISSKVRDTFPENIANEVKSKLSNFLKTQFEDNI
ncbi:transcription and mRNA export factor ENY2 isoform X2 [Histomonas meleagridis]|uniref:transcription and mRNA export factor ENY2 isoform X2 n=1 Tax=Histomonas meleagridis TaxID=135588 RepID=UPI00355A0F58|nr:transcription and mRNA export factor ENY2 isoform X2 [Histomonas meleagridis]KAH0802794.1 transcription and mRNA export factor ENY2 isoform X2 [Histomonas meleagridis]